MTNGHNYLLPEQFEGTEDLSYIKQLELLSSMKERFKQVIDRTSGNPVLDGGGSSIYADMRHLIFPLRYFERAKEICPSSDNAPKLKYELLKAEFSRLQSFYLCSIKTKTSTK